MNFPVPTTFVIRSQVPLDRLAIDIQRSVAQIDKDLPVYDMKPLDEWVAHSLKTRRFVVFLVTLFGVVGAALSALGLYGVLSYWVAVRRREIGIRMAIGATARSIVTLVCSSGLRLLLSGAVLGCLGVVAARRYIAGQLYGVRFEDPITWIAVAAGILIAGWPACLMPAYRAARTNPVEALK
jgi:ABC-type antimicrobial peptide transport system permease subunit